MPTTAIEIPQDKAALNDFTRLYEHVNCFRSAYWKPATRFEMAVLCGESAFNEERTVRPFVAREREQVVARVLAVVDARYQRHWQDPLGHLCWFEALPGKREAVKLLMNEACDWLQSQGATAARAGHGMLEFPFVIDEYETLPPNVLRFNPPYYHSLLKDAGFESEKGFVDYKIEVRPELLVRWVGMLEAARRAGFSIVPLRDVPEHRRVQEFVDTFNDTFKGHWGWTPYSETEIAGLMKALARSGMLETSVLAYRGDEPVGMLLLVPEHDAEAALKPGRMVHDDERLNVLAIGVRESSRGQGVNLAMASYGYLELVRRGAKYLSYTLVLDDNWPSRRTAEKLGAFVCANYVAYRRRIK
jgi:GNAT superfamily N-acetyltransferase